MGPDNGGFLVMDAGWLAGARDLERTDAVFRAVAGELRRRCDELLDPGSPRRLDPDDLDSIWWRTRIGTKQLVCAVWDLAMAGVCFGAEPYGRAAAAILRNLAAHNMAEKGRGTCYRYRFESWVQQPLDTGHASEGLGVAFDLARPFLSADETRAVGTYLVKFIEAAERFVAAEGGPELLDFQNMPMIGRFGLGVLAAALERAGVLDARPHVETARFAALGYLERGGHEEGILCEGPMYGFVCLKHIAVLGRVLSRRGDDAIWESAAWDRIVEAYTSQLIPGDGVPNPWNDCYPARVTSWLLDVAHRRRNGLARWLWEEIVRPLDGKRWDPPVPLDDIRAPWWNGLPAHALVCYDPSVPPVPPREAGVALRRHFVNRGIYDDRSGWDRDDWYLTVACLPDYRWRNRRGLLHHQADRGHFSLYALGEQFAVDSGYGNEMLEGTTQVIRLGQSGEAHNVPEVDGEMQLRSVCAQGIRTVLSDRWVRLARMEFAECYSGCIRVSRTVMVITDGCESPLYAVVHDSIMPRNYALVTFGRLLHTHERNTVRLVGGETADIEGGFAGNRCRVFMSALTPGSLALDTFLNHPRLRHRCRGTTLHGVAVLVPYRAEEPAPVIERSPWHAADAGNGFAVRVSVRGVTDVVALCGQGSVAAFDCETDAEVAVVRTGDASRAAAVDGTYVRSGGATVFSSEQRTTAVRGPDASPRGK